MNKDEVIYDLVKEVREEQRDMRADMAEINHTLRINTLSLQDHIEGVRTLKALHLQNAGRLDSLEAEKKFRQEFRIKVLKIVAAATTIIGLITAVVKYLGTIQ